MKRLLPVVALLAGALALAPAAMAADPIARTGHVILVTEGDIAVPAGDRADAVIVISGHADIRGEVETVVVIDGTATLVGARSETVVAIASQVEVGAGTVVAGEVVRLNSTVHQAGDAEISGGVTDLAATLFEIGAFLAPALVLIWLGFGLATIVAGLFVVAVAPRPVRRATRLIAEDPWRTLLAGIVGMIVLPVTAALLVATLIGAPLGIGLLLVAWPALGFVGYVVAAVWLGEWLVRRPAPAEGAVERPFLAAVVGVVILQLVSFVPVLSIAGAIVSLFGFGAVVRLLVRALRGTPSASAPIARPVAAPTGA